MRRALLQTKVQPLPNSGARVRISGWPIGGLNSPWTLGIFQNLSLWQHSNECYRTPEASMLIWAFSLALETQSLWSLHRHISSTSLR